MAADYQVIINLDQAEVNVDLADKFKVTIEEEGNIGTSFPGGDTSTLQYGYIAAANVGGQRVVMINGGQCIHFDPTNVANVGLSLGLTLNAASAGDVVNVIEAGILTDIGWGLTQDAVYYAGANGTITTTPPVLGIKQRIGVAISPDKMDVRFSEPIIKI